MGYDWVTTLLTFLVVWLQRREKLSTRKGNVILLEPTIAEAISRAKAQIEAKNPELENKDQVHMLLGLEPLNSMTSKPTVQMDTTSTLEAMVSFEGETGPLCTICLRSYPIDLT